MGTEQREELPCPAWRGNAWARLRSVIQCKKANSVPFRWLKARGPFLSVVLSLLSAQAEKLDALNHSYISASTLCRWDSTSQTVFKTTVSCPRPVCPLQPLHSQSRATTMKAQGAPPPAPLPQRVPTAPALLRTGHRGAGSLDRTAEDEVGVPVRCHQGVSCWCAGCSAHRALFLCVKSALRH